MKAVILAAGEGVRMHPLTYTRPKVMLPLANKPILERLVVEVRKVGIEEFVFIVGYGSDTVRDYFGSGEKWGVSIRYVTQKKQLGTAHALGMVEGVVEGSFLVLNGDVLLQEEDISRLISGDGIALAVAEFGDVRGLGVVTVDGDRVLHIYEKSDSPPSNLVNAGLYLMPPHIFQAISQTRKSVRGEYEITDSLQWLIDQGYKVSYVKLDYWLDLGYPWNLLEASESLLTGIEPLNRGVISDNVVIEGPVVVGEGTVVRSGSYIVGPTLIGNDCEIGPNCYIRPSTCIGDRCHIGAAVEVKNSIIMKGTRIPHHNYVGDSIVGEGCNLGAGTKVANLRLDKQNIKIGDVDTGRRKLGVIMGDGVQTGINVSINVGSLIGNGTFIGPGAVVSGVILPNARIF